MSEKKLDLLVDFPAVSTLQWMDKITVDLKGADFDKKLVWKTKEGFNVKPFYRADDLLQYTDTDTQPGKFPYIRGTKPENTWFVRQDIQVKDPKTANSKALELLQKGVSSLGFHLEKKDLSAEYIATLLENIQADCVELNFKICTRSSATLATLLTEYFQLKNYDLKLLQGSINWDAMKAMLLRGKDFTREEITELAKNTAFAAAALPHYKVININATILNNAGAVVTQELGFALAWANDYLSMMVDAGVDTQMAAKKIKFNFGVGSNYFMEIAKFRAARMLWAQIVDAYQPVCRKTDCNHTINGICKCAAKIRIHAETSTFNKTVFDAHVNLLRTQTEAMSAALGGVHSMTILPFDITYKKADDFSERIARNQQLLLKEESNFDKVTDPAAGSYYIETLTHEVAAQAWKLFLEIEDKGGFFATVKSGELQKAVKATANARLKDVSSRREILLGTNQFPNFNEIAGDKVTLYAETSCCEHNEIETLKPVRAARDFEALRFATEAATKRPIAFMLTIGNLAMRLARAQFACNFFACAGYEVIDNLGFNSISEGILAAKNVGADIIVLCSSDDEYASLAPEAHQIIQNYSILVIAGAPACTDELKAIGVEHFINVKTNVLESLKKFHSILKIS